ncbi:MAG TPA: hypothetical protein VMV69_14735 [Pirellulales bacterium]|nr:hypothetical protein [Pirellulales bacterium]
MRLNLQTFSRYRPRVLTLIVFFVAAAAVALANLSFDEVSTGDVYHWSYGWPLVWHRVVRSSWEFFGYRTVGWYYSAPRLAANLAMWLVLLVAPAATCERLLRRYRPRPRWSLRTMLAGVGLAAALCGWFAKARHRADLQDPIIAALCHSWGPGVTVERSGPKWLDLLGADRFRRRVVAVSSLPLHVADPRHEQLFRQLSRLPDLRHLSSFEVDELTPAMAEALCGVPQLRTLDIKFDYLTPGVAVALSEFRQLRSLSIKHRGPTSDNAAEQISRDCLAAIGKMPYLEELTLSNMVLRRESLACLAELKNLKWLSVNLWNCPEPNSQECLAAIARLTQLEWLELTDLKVSNESLACLAGLANLKTLILEGLVTDGLPMLSHLPPLARLEALDLSRSMVDDDDLGRLAVLPHLKSLSLGGVFFRKEKLLITPAGLANLASVESLEEVELEGDIESPEGLEALVAVKRLKRLYLGGNPSTAGDCSGDVTLDDGDKLYVHDVDGFRRALRALRQSKPGIVMEKYGSQVFWRRRGDDVPGSSYDTYPVHESAWLPGSGTEWLTALERAAFEKAGWRVSFDGAAWPDRFHHDGRIVTVSF